jgi:hypothetical protein
MTTAQANAVAPLDQVLVDGGARPFRCWLPVRPSGEHIASRDGQPRKVGCRLAPLADAPGTYLRELRFH